MQVVLNTRTKTSVVAVSCLAVLCGMLGCSATPQPGPISARPVESLAMPNDNLRRLAELHAKRTSESGEREYIVGSGDVLALRAFDFEELTRHVRVDGDGVVTLPLLGSVAVGGLTVAEVEAKLTKRLGEYMYEPYVSVFVEEYRSQQVAVVGSVERPGVVTLTSRDSTILDAVAAAGGMSGKGAGRIYLIPGENRAALDAAQLATMLKGDAPRGAQGGVDMNDAPTVEPLMLDSREVSQGVESVFYSLPVRAGDVIMVPSAGQFILEGWVAKPGTYPLEPGLTLRGALATGGGFMFPADRADVRIYRLTPNGETVRWEVNYADVTAQRAPDVFIHEGDVIEVSSSKVRLVPYGFYQVIKDMVQLSARIPLVP